MEQINCIKVKDYKAGFWKGWQQLQLKNVTSARRELFEALGIHEDSRMSWQNYRNGKTEPSASRAAAIEGVFAKYGITDVWGGKTDGQPSN